MVAAAAEVGKALAAAAQAVAQAAAAVNPPPPPRKAPASPVDEGARAILDKEAKLNVAREAVLIDDLQKLAEADREKVRLMEEKSLGLQREAEDVGSTIVVCDDYDASTKVLPPSRTAWWPALVTGALLLGGAGLTFAFWPRSVPPTAVQPGVTAPQKWDAVYEEQQPDGTWKEVRRDHLK